MERLIEVYNKLSDVISVLKDTDFMEISFPRLVVVGSQSSGKSSVLESIVGRDFLPRGLDIVTRCPLLLKLVNNPQVKREYGMFLHRGEQRYFDFEEIKAEIEAETDRITGYTKAISYEQIVLQICGPEIPNLTLVDLPGLTKVAVSGQPEDISLQIRKLVESYIKPASTIILAIIPANIDIANSDALKLGSKYDPDRNRTLGIITKLDLVDESADIVGLASGNKFFLKLGYVPVLNRSQHDIKNGKSIREAMEMEKNFFKNKAFSFMADKCGYEYLRSYLVEVLVSNIRRDFPVLRSELNSLLYKYETQFKEQFGTDYNSASLDEDKSWSVILSECLDDFTGLYKNILNGMSVIEFNDLYGGSVLHQIIITEFFAEIEKIKYFDQIDEGYAQLIFKNARGVKSDFGYISRALDQLVKSQVSKFRDPIKKVLFLTNEKLKEFIDLVEMPSVYEKLKVKISSVLHELIDRHTDQCSQMTEQLLDVQMSEVNYYSQDILLILKELVVKDTRNNLFSKIQQSVENAAGENSNASGVRSDTDSYGGINEDTEKKKQEANNNNNIIDNKNPPKPTKKYFNFNLKRSVKQPVEAKPNIEDDLKLSADRYDFEPVDTNFISYAQSLVQLFSNKYFVFLKRSIADKVSKIILYFLVKKIDDQLYKELVNKLLFEDSKELFTEISKEFQIQKKALYSKIVSVKKLQQVISEL